MKTSCMGSESETPAVALRRRAEGIARGKAFRIPEDMESLSVEAARQMLHELRVHQIELEMQNEELRRAQAELDAAQARYFNLYDLAPMGYCTLSDQGRILEVNLTAATLLGVAKSALVKQPIFRFILPEDQDIYYQHRKQLFETHSTSSGQAGEPQACELRMVKSDGTAFWAHLAATAAQDADGAPVCRVVLIDITARKRAEEQLHASLREKEILLGEVHHRVKNNMQVISGLLDLQASSSENPELIAMFHESQSRIQAMSLVHEKLYGSKDFTRIDLADYVRTLSKELLQSYKINQGKIDLIVQADGEVYVDINKAIPCGLILNELISNALKHAFPGDRPCELRIIIHETKNTEIEIVVRDNGLGLPDDVDIHQPRTVGLHLVNGLVEKQLDGQIEVRRDNGTEFQIKFPL